MSDDSTVKGVRRLNTSNTMTNALSFMVEQTVRDMVNTSDLVCVGSADQNGTDGPAGFGSATPLVAQVDGYNNTLSPATLSKLRYFRYQAGDCAFVIDPQPGDKCVAVFQKRDSSAVGTGTSSAVQPGSFRCFDQADGVIFPSVQGPAPKVWVHLKPDHDIDISTDSAKMTLSVRDAGDIEISTASGTITLKATERIVMDAPEIVMLGRVDQTGERNSSASSFRGGFTNTGGVITSNGVTVETHTHNGVESGSGNTGSPNAGT